MKLLLDTHVVLWLLTAQRDKIPNAVIQELGSERNELLVSAASIWEISIKRSIGKLTLAPGWFKALKQLDFTHLPISSEHAAEVENLPQHHKDPFDRLLISQAQIEHAAIVTRDPQISNYEVSTLWA